MNKSFLSIILLLLTMESFAQKQTFDVVNYIMPKGWDKTEQPNGIQLSTKNDGKADYAAAVIIRAVATSASPNENFNNSWEKLVKGTVNVSVAPSMQAPQIDKGWDIISGQANYTDGSNKGLVILITATGNGKMANVVLMTNAQKYQAQLLEFISSLKLNEAATTANDNNGAIGANILEADKNSRENPTSSINNATNNGIYSITVPPTWNLKATGNSLILEKNTGTGKKLIEFMPAIKSSGNLEKDMAHIFFEVFDSWNLYNSTNDLLFEKGDHEKGFTCQGLPYYMLSNSINQKGNGNVIKGTVLLIQVEDKVAIINSADAILGSEIENALNFLLFSLKINGVSGKNVDYKNQLTGTWGASSGSYGNNSSFATRYTAEGKYYVLAQSSYTVGYDYYNDLIKSKQFKSQGQFSIKSNVLERKSGSSAATKYFIRFYSRKYGNLEWRNLMGFYLCDYDKNRIETVFPFTKF